jgi:hypothetical protein
MGANDGLGRKKANETQLQMAIGVVMATGLKIAQSWPWYLCFTGLFLLFTTKYLYGTSACTVDALHFRSTDTLRRQDLDCPKYTVCFFSCLIRFPL